jgi:hypothetical protein
MQKIKRDCLTSADSPERGRGPSGEGQGATVEDLAVASTLGRETSEWAHGPDTNIEIDG